MGLRPGRHHRADAAVARRAGRVLARRALPVAGRPHPAGHGHPAALGGALRRRLRAAAGAGLAQGPGAQGRRRQDGLTRTA
ncbi:hypothetical protein SBRY_10590 [Actinacidiphila bryophytorum]|uniref:Uncharacterized protein n=1 Tax=Actinacidiphila bryophytorum TaxID=1436133 RepID=A0A9W4GXB0_9ACTN|nr:hypothetical protein SBRY_10590 [Actinacidiphila bryophytorum]